MEEGQSKFSEMLGVRCQPDSARDEQVRRTHLGFRVANHADLPSREPGAEDCGRVRHHALPPRTTLSRVAELPDPAHLDELVEERQGVRILLLEGLTHAGLPEAVVVEAEGPHGQELQLACIQFTSKGKMVKPMPLKLKRQELSNC